MAGIYIHIPFCKSKCSYCDFYSIANSSAIEGFIHCLQIEIKKQKSIFEDQTIDTIYFGGGTPSILSIDQIQLILDCVFDNYSVSGQAEITLEANPDDLSYEYLSELKSTKINRLSIGIQSLETEILKVMRRRHTSDEAIQVVELAANLGFSNISVDLIYGIEGLSNEIWKETILKTLALPVTHLSAYHLGIEKGTLLYRKYQEGQFHKVSENKSLQQYEILVETAAQSEFSQYEISNFAKTGMQSIHNSSYWTGNEYIGFGPSAHSFFRGKRQFNISNVKKYCELIHANEVFYETEDLSVTDRINEMIMLSLRTTKGLNLAEFRKEFGEITADSLLKKTLSLNPEHYNINKNNLTLTQSGIFISDSIMAELFE